MSRLAIAPCPGMKVYISRKSSEDRDISWTRHEDYKQAASEQKTDSMKRLSSNEQNESSSLDQKQDLIEIP